jgi:CheY-like chemotaxis protein
VASSKTHQEGKGFAERRLRLQRLRSIQRLLLDRQCHPDAAQTRQRAEQGLRELIDRVAAQQLVVLWIDDLQWGDLDSTSILRHWLAQPGAAPVMLIFSYRAEELETSACLRALDLPPRARDRREAD